MEVDDRVVVHFFMIAHASSGLAIGRMMVVSGTDDGHVYATMQGGNIIDNVYGGELCGGGFPFEDYLEYAGTAAHTGHR